MKGSFFSDERLRFLVNHLPRAYRPIIEVPVRQFFRWWRDVRALEAINFTRDAFKHLLFFDAPTGSIDPISAIPVDT
ncbi:MAG: hypothetical protein ABI433_00390 [Burkholderiaceae bacterium]